MSAEIATNRKAGRDFHILDKYEAGLELKGTEVKSIRAGKINVSDAFARVEGHQIFLYGCDIQPWQTAGEWFNHLSKRPRRLLLHKREILKLSAETAIRGCSACIGKIAGSKLKSASAKAKHTLINARI